MTSIVIKELGPFLHKGYARVIKFAQSGFSNKDKVFLNWNTELADLT